MKLGTTIAIALLGACASTKDTATPTTTTTPTATTPDETAPVTGATFTEDATFFGYYGDLWANTWADDDRLYLSFGDGTGSADCVPTSNGVTPSAWTEDWSWVEAAPGCFVIGEPCETCVMQQLFCGVYACGTECYPLCPFTPAGLVALSGPVPDLDPCAEDDCVVARHLPTLDEETARANSDKPSSLLFLDGTLYMAGHTPGGEPSLGYLARSDDYGVTWTTIEGSPWGADSPFRVLMLVNMGQAYAGNTDGYVYGLGVEAEFDEDTAAQEVRLARCPKAGIADYDQWTYFSGTAAAPDWSEDPADAVPLDGLQTMAQAAAIRHEGTGRYLFLSGLDSMEPLEAALYEAPEPWGPWTRVAAFTGGYIPSLVTKGAGADWVHFTLAGGAASYNLNIGRLQLEVGGG